MSGIGTWIVAILLIAIVGAIVWKLIHDKQQGKSSCGCDCGCCANEQICHSNTKQSRK